MLDKSKANDMNMMVLKRIDSQIEEVGGPDLFGNDRDVACLLHGSNALGGCYAVNDSNSRVAGSGWVDSVQGVLFYARSLIPRGCVSCYNAFTWLRRGGTEENSSSCCGSLSNALFAFVCTVCLLQQVIASAAHVCLYRMSVNEQQWVGPSIGI